MNPLDEPTEPPSESAKTPAARRALRILAAAVVLVLVVLAALPYLVSLESVRARVLSAAQSALHRKVEAGRIRLQIFSGVGAGAENVVVRNKEGWESPALLTANRASVKLAFWPLLSRRIEVRRVVLEGVTLSVERDPKGAWNVDDFLSASGRPSEGARPATAAALLIANLEIVRGRLAFLDRKIVPGETVTTVLEELNGRVWGISPSSPARFELVGRFLADTGRNLALKGTFGPPKEGKPLGESPIGVSLSAKNLALAKLGPYLGANQEADPGVFSADVSADGVFLAVLRLAGTFALVPREGGGSRMPALDGQFVSTLDWPHGSLVLEKSQVSVAKLPLTVQGRVDDLRTTRRLDLKFGTAGEVAVDGVTGLPGAAGTLPPSVKLSGRVRLTAEVTGPAGDRTRHASLAAGPFEVSEDGQSIFTATSATATLESRGPSAVSGRLAVPAGNLKGAPFENLLADWSLEKGVLTLAPTVDADAARSSSESRASVDLTDARGQALVDALTKLLQQYLQAPVPAPTPR